MAQKILKILNNATVSAVVGAIVSALLGILVGYIGRDIQLHDAVTYNNISSYIESLLVEPGYVEPDILEKENPFQQIERIGQEFGEKESESKVLADSIRGFLTETGEKSNIAQLDNAKLSEMLNAKAQEIKELQAENGNLNEQIGEYQSQVLARLSTPEVHISGELLDTTLQDYLAVINAHRYYSEEFLDSFLPKGLLYESNVIYYDKEAPERVQVNAELIYDRNNFVLYDGSTHFTMGLHDYSVGIRTSTNYSAGHSLKIACDEKYSKIVFTLGHIDNTNFEKRSLTISYMDNSGNFQEAMTFSLYADMPVEEHEVPIYNTRTIKITASGSGSYGCYGLADIYLVK